MIDKIIPDPNYSDRTRIYFSNDGASAFIMTYGEKSNSCFLFDFYSTIRGKGYATKLLKEIDQYCKNSNLILIIISEPYEDDKNLEKRSPQSLKNFYIKAGAILFGYDEKNESPLLKMGAS